MPSPSLQKNAGAVRRFARLRRFGNWLQNIPNKTTPPPFRLVQISSSFWQSRSLYVAARLDIATALADGQLSVSEIATLVSADADAVGRLLRMLAAMGIFEETAPGVFRNNRLSAPLRQDSPECVRAMILMHNSPQMSRPWFEELEGAVRSGEVAFQRSHGQELFDYMDHHPEFDDLFSRAMDSVEALAGDAFAQDFDWSRFTRLIDVGGSRGSKSLAILKRHPQLQALVVDREQIVRDAVQYWQGRESASLLSRLSFETGDLFGQLPSAQGAGDIYLLSAVLHGFDDEQCAAGLRNLARLCGQTGARIAVLEIVLPEQGADLVSASFDMQMFIGTRGRERTLTQWCALFDRSGLELDDNVGLQTFARILVVRPRHR
ncbi:MAG: methyltransferase [Pseudohongiellaceae bacterium]